VISAILLAAGESRRMGRFKQLLELGEKTFIEHCVDNLRASHVEEIIVVTGHREAEVRSVLERAPVRFAHNAGYRSGMSSSIKVGVQAVSDRATACLISLVDQPRIDTDIINKVVAEYERCRRPIVIPTFGAKRGHPIILDLSLKEEILAIDESIGLRQVISAHSSEIGYVEVHASYVVEDCDSPEDYERLKDRR
jgi:molybdenum cofactor cytidylyltransferase